MSRGREGIRFLGGLEMPLADLGPERANGVSGLAQTLLPLPPGFPTHPLPDLCRPALTRSVWGIPLPLRPLSLSAPSSKCLSFPLCPDPLLKVLRTFWGLLGKATDQPTHLIPLARRHTTTVPTLNANQNAPLRIPHLPPAPGVFCFPLQQTAGHKELSVSSSPSR